MSLTLLRHTRACRRVVLCLLLSWCSAFASPLIKPAVLHVVCGTAGLELVAQSESSHNDGFGHVLGQTCAACLPIGLPPAGAARIELHVLPAAEPGEATRAFTPAFLLPVPPARGPPLFVPDLT